MPLPSNSPSALQLRDIDTNLASKPMRSAYGTQVAEYFKPAMRGFFTEDVQDQRINALVTLAKELGSPTFMDRKENEGLASRGEYSPWDKEIRIHPEYKDKLNIYDYKGKSGRPRLYTQAEDVALEELAHAYQDTHDTDVWKREIYEDRDERATIFSKKGRGILKKNLGMSLLNIVRQLPDTDFTSHVDKKLYNIVGYTRPGSLEHDAHKVVSPELKKRYFSELGESAGDYYR